MLGDEPVGPFDCRTHVWLSYAVLLSWNRMNLETKLVHYDDKISRYCLDGDCSSRASDRASDEKQYYVPKSAPL